jgi:uncharacterized caspase-like protein
LSGRLASLCCVIVAALMLVAGLGHSAHSKKRVALVVGYSAYQSAVKLDNPANDAKLISDTLSSLGFSVVGGGARLDLDKAGFDAALREFSRESSGADIALFYFVGHGVEIGKLNYVAPVDAKPQENADILSDMTSVAGIREEMEKSGARINIALVDACRGSFKIKSADPSIRLQVRDSYLSSGTDRVIDGIHIVNDILATPEMKPPC